jgi:preprotein translocase subunit Sss1
MHDDNDLYEPNSREWLFTLVTTALTLGLLGLVGYYTPALVAVAIR